MTAPNSEQRQKCWHSRDLYWKCLDDNNDDDTKCTKQKAEFEGSCAKQWVKHFVRRRAYLKFQAQQVGFVPADEKNSS